MQPGTWILRERNVLCLVPAPSLVTLSRTHLPPFPACLQVSKVLVHVLVLCLSVVLPSAGKTVILVAFLFDPRNPKLAALSGLSLPGEKRALREGSAELSAKSRSHEQALTVMNLLQRQVSVKIWSMVSSTFIHVHVRLCVCTCV